MKRRAVLGLLLASIACGEESPLAPENPAGKGDKKAPGKGPNALVTVGLERIEADKGGPLKGRKVGLIAHAASVAGDRHAIDVLRAQGVTVVRLFTPEHGLRGRAAAGERIDSGVDPESKLPVVSLYGAKTKPSTQDLQGIDVLVFDLQDAGVRFYTYVSTLIHCLEAAAEADIEFMVLDRPNPLGGERVEGPVRDAAAPTSLVSLAPGPLVHGLTAGEMARYVNEKRKKPAKLTVVPLNGWVRRMTWAETGRTWVPPSPNLRSAAAAIAYPGVCVLEPTTVSEGRGTDAPFLLLGAPWLQPRALESLPPVPGFAFVPTTFTPVANRAAPEPKHAGQECHGLRVEVTNAEIAQSYRLGVTLLWLLRQQSGFKWTGDGHGLDRLLGTSRVREALDRGDRVDAILEADAAAITAWRKDRTGALLY